MNQRILEKLLKDASSEFFGQPIRFVVKPKRMADGSCMHIKGSGRHPTKATLSYDPSMLERGGNDDFLREVVYHEVWGHLGNSPAESDLDNAIMFLERGIQQLGVLYASLLATAKVPKKVEAAAHEGLVSLHKAMGRLRSMEEELETYYDRMAHGIVVGGL